MECILNGFLYAAFAFAIACTHNGHTAIFQYRLHIVEVEVDKTMISDDFCDAFCCDAQGIVGFAKSIENGQFWIDFPKTFVVDDQKRIDMLRHLLYAIKGLVDFLIALEAEGNGNDAHGENI